MKLRTQRLNIRPFSKSDILAVTPMLKDPLIMKTTGFKTPQSDEQIEKHTHKWINTHEDLYLSLIHNSTHEYIGWYMVKIIDSNTVELGYMIDKKYWGKGFATEASSSIVKKSRELYEKQSIVATVDPGNIASQKVLEKNDFEFTGKKKDILTYKYRF